MAQTENGPALSFNDQLKSLFFDTARYRLIDVETVQDDNNVPDRVDVAKGRAGAVSQNALGLPGVAGRVPWVPIVIGLGLFAGAWKLLK